MRDIRNCSVCVIGGAGFLGSHLVNYLLEKRNCQVLVLDNLISGLRKHIHKKAKFVWHDIRESELETTKILKSHDVQYVFNYAAEPYIPEGFERPLHFFDINAVAVLKVLNACQAANVRAILQVSSAEIYGDAKGKISEDAPVIPHSTYGVSKMAADGLVQVRWREAKVPAIAMRQFNCVGERETHEYVIPEIISQLDHIANASTTAVVRLGNNSERDFQYAGDAVRMAVELLEKGQFGEVYNMGSESTIKIYALAELIGKIMGHDQVVVSPDMKRMRPWEIWHLQSDNTKLYSVIEARPSVTLREALQRTADYYLSNGCKWDW
ncbi:GDP-mannose 4,6-dehydratase [Candidatus Pacearchaeota archaeon]|nr:GDP-mannose 4,6-dehydratase [Candidatus Pacearchaeota archaeon]